MKRMVLVGALLLGLARPASATPITWEFQGAVNSSQLSQFPVGTSVTLDWTADPATANACGGSDPAVGVYFGQSLVERIGGMTFQIDGILTVGTNVSRGCSGAPDNSVQLSLVNWSGPDLREGPLGRAWPCCFSPAMFWTNAGPTGAYPLLPPSFALLQGPTVNGGRASVTSSVQVVPEPASLTLLVLGGAVAWRRRRDGH
jgi:MYXO-CTERM domain-containing protein